MNWRIAASLTGAQALLFILNIRNSQTVSQQGRQPGRKLFVQYIETFQYLDL
jgi:hypothetical protein